MKKILKIAGIAVAVMVGLLIVAVAVVNLIPGSTYKSLITSAVKSATGREMTIDGDLDIKLLNSFAFKASDIKFANAEWGSRPLLASVDTIEADVALLPLFKGILDASLVVDQPDVLLETDSSGRGNWQFSDPESEAGIKEDSAASAEDDGKEKAPAREDKGKEKEGGLPIKPLIRKLHLNQARFTYVDAQKGDHLEIDSEKLHVGSKEKNLVVDISGQYNQIPLALTGGLDNDHFFVDNKPAGIKLNGHFGDAKLSVEGSAGPYSPVFDADVTAKVETKSLAAVAPLAGRALPDIGPLTVSARLMGKAGRYSISDLAAVLDDPMLSAKADGAVADLNALEAVSYTHLDAADE